jgi:hypothetical protein
MTEGLRHFSGGAKDGKTAISWTPGFYSLYISGSVSQEARGFLSRW